MAKSIQIMLAIAVWYNYEIWQMDVKMASFNGFVEEEIYMDQPEGFTVVGEEQKDLGEASYILLIKIFRDRSKRILGMTQNSYQACAWEAHWTVVKTILKYLRRTKDVFLVYDSGELILEGFSDASFQSDNDDAKSQPGFVFKLNGGVVVWKSFKQDTTTDSTTEAEYIAASKAAKEAVWMKNYIKELGVLPSIAERVVIFYDNNGGYSTSKGTEILSPIQIYS
ncbi:UNVERIFIED_CONTAM: Secreted RxLR effector protein [Sesamum angustifolium]|uniref:Secreted RxLR effector protein n=1 Tax=Sesamum angustifolium TaxID=2727405 RepID=A0AAW2MM36_9LAMI